MKLRKWYRLPVLSAMALGIVTALLMDAFASGKSQPFDALVRQLICSFAMVIGLMLGCVGEARLSGKNATWIYNTAVAIYFGLLIVASVVVHYRHP